MSRTVFRAVSAACMVLAASWVTDGVAQGYPTRTVTMVVPFAAGLPLPQAADESLGRP